MESAGTTQLYKPMDTRRYLLIHTDIRAFYDEDHRPLSREAAMDYVLS